MNWRVVVAVIVAFVVGAGGGALAEHQRVKNDKKHSSASKSTTTGTGTATGTTTNWFGKKKPAACVELRKWSAAGTVSFSTIYSAKPWNVNQATLAAQAKTITTAYENLAKLANPHGAAELTYLASYERQVSAAVQHATSMAAFLKAEKTLGATRYTRDAAVVSRAAKACPKA